MRTNKISGPKRLLHLFITILLTASCIEAISCLGTYILTRKVWMAYIPHLSQQKFNQYLNKRSIGLGWGPETDSAGKIIHAVARTDPAFPSNQTPCVSAYGDSFTHGSLDDATYPHFLSLNLNCAVANYGVGGYGSDQALMLFRAQADLDQSTVVILGHFTENILRNVNQYRNLLYPGDELALKPRFILEGERLHYVPPPVNSLEDFRSLEENPKAKLPLEAFIDRPRRNFPYTLALLRWLFTDSHVRAKLAGIPRYAEFYKPGHPSGALQLTARILETFVQEAGARGKRGAVLLIPSADDIEMARKTGEWVDQPLADILTQRGVTVIHAGPQILGRIGNEDLCKIYEGCVGHFNAAGYQLLASILADELRARAWLQN
ncbi:MAG: hypothetical protein AUG51_10270 [Acidobacteria bacterium 13_1_20CM_3_53_8]|nr:MAG: hypothetical protein AUG51_10270 [Acidobacteria bacterium 13_1_20CM_3_53_8]